MTESTVRGFVVREKHCLLAKKIRFIRQANKADVSCSLSLLAERMIGAGGRASYRANYSFFELFLEIGIILFIIVS
jgi:hypothetical protein